MTQDIAIAAIKGVASRTDRLNRASLDAMAVGFDASISGPRVVEVILQLLS
jgi:hypothetical protein